jgi:hypothetical protein
LCGFTPDYISGGTDPELSAFKYLGGLKLFFSDDMSYELKENGDETASIHASRIAVL